MRITLAAVALVLASPASLLAQDFEFDFEPPTYVPGPLSAQGWTAPFGANVVTGFARAGSQSVHLNEIHFAVSKNLTSLGGWRPSGLWQVNYSMYVASPSSGVTRGLRFKMEGMMEDGTSFAGWEVAYSSDGQVVISSGIATRSRSVDPSQLVDQWIDVTVTGGGVGDPFTVRLQGANLDLVETQDDSPRVFEYRILVLSNVAHGTGYVDEIRLGPLGGTTATRKPSWGGIKGLYR